MIGIKPKTKFAETSMTSMPIVEKQGLPPVDPYTPSVKGKFELVGAPHPFEGDCFESQEAEEKYKRWWVKEVSVMQPLTPPMSPSLAVPPLAKTYVLSAYMLPPAVKTGSDDVNPSTLPPPQKFVRTRPSKLQIPNSPLFHENGKPITPIQGIPYQEENKWKYDPERSMSEQDRKRTKRMIASL